jgi:hypothetical protein
MIIFIFATATTYVAMNPVASCSDFARSRQSSFAALSHGGVTEMSRVDFANWTHLNCIEQKKQGTMCLLYDVLMKLFPALFCWPPKTQCSTCPTPVPVVDRGSKSQLHQEWQVIDFQTKQQFWGAFLESSICSKLNIFESALFTGGRMNLIGKLSDSHVTQAKATSHTHIYIYIKHYKTNKGQQTQPWFHSNHPKSKTLWFIQPFWIGTDSWNRLPYIGAWEGRLRSNLVQQKWWGTGAP